MFFIIISHEYILCFVKIPIISLSYFTWRAFHKTYNAIVLLGYIAKEVLANKPAIIACSGESLFNPLLKEQDTN